MKKIIFLFLMLVLVVCASSCLFPKDLLDTQTINGKEYKRAFIGVLHPQNLNMEDENTINVSGVRYHKFTASPFDSYVAYDRYAQPNIYYASEQYEEAVAFYTNPDCFNYYCLIGNVFEEENQEIFEIESADAAMFDRLAAFCKEKDYNPLDSTQNNDGLKRYPTDKENLTTNEIRFYKESKDGVLISLKCALLIEENKLHLLYYYDGSTDETVVRELPVEINDYFCSLLSSLKSE